MPDRYPTRFIRDAATSIVEPHLRQEEPVPAPKGLPSRITQERMVARAVAASDALALQRMIGNQALSRMLSGAAPRPSLSAAGRSRPSLQRKLVLGKTEYTSAEQFKQDLGPVFDEMPDTVQALISLPAAPVRLPDVDALRQVHAYMQDETKRPAKKEAIVAVVQLLSHGAWTRTQATGKQAAPTFDAFNTKAVRTNLTALGDFLKANPNVVANLKAAGVWYQLMVPDQQLSGYGGAAVIDDRIQIAGSILSEDPEGFMRMAIHETGHATFQRMLITGEGWTDDANRGKQPPDERALDADGQKFYAAWSEIRKLPEFFFVTDMPAGGAEAKGKGRQGYLAGQFSEFCADSFMHMALMKNELVAHVANLPEEAGAVKSAWQTALSVLVKYESQVLGRQPNAGAATIVGHRSNLDLLTLIPDLKAALQGTELKASAPEKARELVGTLRKAWNGLTPAGRERHRGETLDALDQYMWKVQARRPAQRNLGSELGFAGL